MDQAAAATFGNNLRTQWIDNNVLGSLLSSALHLCICLTTSGFVLVYSSTDLMFQLKLSKPLKLLWHRLVEVLVLPQRRTPQKHVPVTRKANTSATIRKLLK